MMVLLDENFWSERYKLGLTGWDIGCPSIPLVQYLDQIENKSIRVLIPGAGNAYEADYALRAGFTNVNVLDVSAEPLERFRLKHPDFPKDNLHHQDFFNHSFTYDLILEQTFFCALAPGLREKYSQKMLELLNPGGKLVGVLFNRTFDFQGPPFGGKKEEYLTYFTGKFEVETFEPCYNSIPQRSGSEFFIKLKKSEA
ncbi:MAG: SAM-dependent methyltransferase [Algoriphagus sp.]|nr:SAM-dependent methyltransferase [Algoriphagus sp.]